MTGKKQTKTNPKLSATVKRRLRRQRSRAGGIPIARRIPRQVVRTPLSQNVYRGRDFLTTVSLPASLSVSNCQLVNLPVSPGRFVGTRISLLAQAYDKYRFKRLSLHYVPSVPVTVGGQIVIYFDLDVKDGFGTAQSTDIVIRDAMAHQGAQLTNVHDAVVVNMPIAPGLKDFFTGASTGNDQLYYQAKAWVIGVAGLNGTGAPSTGTVGSLFVDYEVHFEGEQLQEQGAAADSEVLSSALTNCMAISNGVVTASLTMGAQTSVIFGGVTMTQGFLTNDADGVYTGTLIVGGSNLNTYTPFLTTRNLTVRYVAVLSGGYGVLLKPAVTATGSVAPALQQFANFGGTTSLTNFVNIPNTDDTQLLLDSLTPPPVNVMVEDLRRQIGELMVERRESRPFRSTC